MKNLAWFLKAMVAALGAAGAGALGGTLGQAEPMDEDRLAVLERSCQKMDVRMATNETKVSGVEASLVDIKKDLAEIRSTNTQILFILRDR